jgi:starvation-inducible DNA-binding protein
MNQKSLATHQSLPKDMRGEVATLLNHLLATASDLYSHAKQAHWNVRGRDFMGIHELFDKVAEEAAEHADQIAERAGQLGFGVDGTLRQAAKATALPEYPLGLAASDEHIEQLSKSLGAFSKHLVSAIETTDKAGDPVTTDILTQICGAVDKMLWFVESHLTVAKPSAVGAKRAS